MSIDQDSWYPETERMIADYWRAKVRMERLRAKEDALLASIKRLELQLEEVRRIPGLTAKYGLVPRAQRGADRDYSDLMVEYEEQIDKITKILLEKQKQLASIRHRLLELQELIAPMEAIMAKLTSEERLITEQRYIYRRSNYQIAELLHCSEHRLRYMLKRIISRVAEWTGKKRCRKIDAPEMGKRGIMVS
ncbi:MAG TPA: sigma-70 family RNA polymerase sigma factor [Firmicutes bacterium]|nr:sigma-70 family RNA polymerase sigma factor [Bacillota bacterium]